jgi:hypothetical protein
MIGRWAAMIWIVTVKRYTWGWHTILVIVADSLDEVKEQLKEKYDDFDDDNYLWFYQQGSPHTYSKPIKVIYE